ncbi:MAG TPA: Gfo/Idh/MocA family oxidoreductase [Terriglobales bacterium]|nr:Gfo/Idh/MocA family oxidoreductase [Terriglobales bacterium]
MMNIAVVGYDHAHLPRYVPAIAAHPRVRLTSLVAPGVNRALARQHAQHYGVRYLESLDELWANGRVDAAYVGTPPDQHLPVIRELASRGIHILCDKPLATTLEDADAILEVTRQHKVTLMVPFNPRYQLPVIKLKGLIDQGELGEVQHIHATKYGKIPRGLANLNTNWFFDPAQAGFGGFGDIGIHAVDALRWLANAEAKSVFARIDRLIYSDMAVDDMGTLMIEFENGVIASLQSGWVNPKGNAAWLSVSFEVLGTRGAVVIDKPYHDLEIADGEKNERIPWWRADIASLFNEFITAVEEHRSPAISGSDARAALEIIIAAYQSAQTGAAVALPLGS